ncbi:isoaspartyl peptidase/L-asparaginase family protein [Sphingomonas qomolangmaensis]|uniref:Isoaspartyl peptidase/L-asparaginase n=1 Tax=Sphingomonas qomolangmaensis TaxID=2918765 RepID=A0ABY5L726_9SPHN|nr:isoaspartyl peptidase/L-asparaginase [Sphingomonas qomolangmaensis]UUL81776.1 isoaspartyl peptidase/L-asparaginase [Sphingomonas qomolangmaensis]
MTATPAAAQDNPGWTLVIHGGAGVIERARMTPERETAARAGLNAALDAGTKVLAAGGSALDAVEAAVRVLEDDPSFNAGRGAVFTYEGTNELDAAIMEGTTRKAGAVAGINATKNPIGLARAVMENSPHVMLAGEGANRFSREQKLEQAGPEWFATDERRRQLDELKSQGASAYDIDMKYGTVGAVARDAKGHVAAATSTGGVTGKRCGRIGDSPLIGAGTYADDRACAISATGAGEFFIREGVAHEICARVRFKGETLKAAADVVMAETLALGGTGGVIVTGPSGEMAYSFNTPGMYRGMANAGGKRSVAIYGDE